MVRTIKLLKRVLLLGSIAIGTVSMATTQGYSETDYSCAQPAGRGGDGGGNIVWPWGFEVMFPWDDVQGIWKVQKGEKAYFFSFRRVEEKRIKIKQIDLASCKTIGIGQGMEKPNSKVIVAQIRNTHTAETYNLTIYAFNQEDSPEPPMLNNTSSDHVIVARINSLDHAAPEFAAQMVRISDRLEFRCGDQDKKTKF